MLSKTRVTAMCPKSNLNLAIAQQLHVVWPGNQVRQRGCKIWSVQRPAHSDMGHAMAELRLQSIGHNVRPRRTRS